jgi:hypothetical protein
MTDTQRCILTIHGIGFQQPPGHGVAGYADQLHEKLAAGLPGQLGDLVYVESAGRPAQPARVLALRPRSKLRT